MQWKELKSTSAYESFTSPDQPLSNFEVASVFCKGFVYEDSAGNRYFLKGFEARKLSSNVKGLAVILCTHMMPRI